MEKKCRLIKRFVTLCIAVVLLNGCGRESKESTNTAMTESQEVGESIEITDTSEENDEQGYDEMGQRTVSNSLDESEMQTSEEPVRVVTIYYVDDISTVVIGQEMEISDEYDIWDELINKGVLTDECYLLGLNIDEIDQTLNLDFNAATAERINRMGTTGEAEIVGCIINTYLEAYNCTGIRLTVEGEEFVTSHGAEFTDYPGRITFE